MKYEYTIEQVNEKLLSGELTSDNFYCPIEDFKHLPNVKVHGNILLSWNDVITIHPVTKKHVNITKPNQEDYDIESLRSLEHSFNDKVSEAVKAEYSPNECPNIY